MIDASIYREMGLNDSEFQKIVETLGREPSITEIGMYAVMWSEHCGYKYSRPVLRLFKKYAEAMDTGEVENAGVVDIGGGMGVVMKMESHNHPSAVEPFQGAATGMGGILRDIFTMGARPIANLNSLRFGPLADSRSRYLFERVVEGIAHYGNCLTAEERLVWRDASGVHFDTIGSFVDARLTDDDAAATLEMIDSDISILSMDADKMAACWRPLRRVFRRKAKSLVRIKTALGRSVTVTPDHPMVVLVDGEWQYRLAGSIEAGAQLPILTALPEIAEESSSSALPAPVDFISELVSDGVENLDDIWVQLPSDWTPTLEARSRIMSLGHSAYTRHRRYKQKAFSLHEFLQLEDVLGVKRSQAMLYRRGKANRMAAVVEMTPALARLIGYYLAEGCVSQNGNTAKVVFTFAHHEQEYVDDVAAILAQLGLRVCTERRVSTLAVTATSWQLAFLLKKVWQCGTSASNKAFPAALFTWPRHLQREALKGVLRGDGSFTTHAHGSHAKISFATSSRKLFDQTLALVQAEGAVPYIYSRDAGETIIQGRRHQRKKLWQLEVTNVSGLTALCDVFGSERTRELRIALANYQGNKYSFPRFRTDNEIAVVKVADVEPLSDGETSVYDVEVEGTHLFATTSGLVVHNCVGVPTVGGEIYFDPCYLGNPLVNAMSVGVVALDKVASAAAEGVGNVVIYVGSATGRDGIHGATFASVELGPDSESKRPNVQIGDPFQEKLLIEATLEALASGAIVGIQDMGAAGLTCSTCETAAKASNGMEIDVRLVPTREGDMTPYEIMLSESQERMLAIAKREDADTVLNIFKKWGLSAAVVGTVTDTGRVEIKDNGVVVADIPAKSLTDECPTYYLDSHEPAYIKQVQFNAPGMPESDVNGHLLKLLGSLSIASKRWVYQQYDHMVQTQTTVMPGDADAAVLRVRGTEKAIALTTDCNSRYCYLDPYVGSMHAVAEAARNLSCCGARPAAVTDCLNFPNPEKPDNFWVFRTCVQGLADACEKFGTPVISGNVSFYNETPAHAIFPTPTIGMIGVIDDPSLRMTMSFKDEGDVIYALGLGKPQLRGGELSYLLTGEAHGHPPVLDLDEELAVQAKLRDLIASGKVKSAHDASDGGIAVALAECAIKGKRGADVSLVESETDGVTTLYGERSATILITTAPDMDLPAEHKASGGGVSLIKLGTVGGDRLIFRTAAQETLDLPVARMTDVFESAIPEVRWRGW